MRTSAVHTRSRKTHTPPHRRPPPACHQMGNCTILPFQRLGRTTSRFVINFKVRMTVDPTMSRGGAESILESCGFANGNYVLRCSASHPGSYVLVVAYLGSCKHYPVEACPAPAINKFTVLCPGDRRQFQGVEGVIRYYTLQKGGICCKLTKRCG